MSAGAIPGEAVAPAIDIVVPVRDEEDTGWFFDTELLAEAAIVAEGEGAS